MCGSRMNTMTQLMENDNSTRVSYQHVYFFIFNFFFLLCLIGHLCLVVILALIVLFYSCVLVIPFLIPVL